MNTRNPFLKVSRDVHNHLAEMQLKRKRKKEEGRKGEKERKKDWAITGK